MTDPGDAGQGDGQTVLDQAVGESGGHCLGRPEWQIDQFLQVADVKL